MFFDSHAHLDDKRFDPDREQLIIKLPECGVSRVINVGASMKSSRISVELAKEYDFIWASVGVHPHDAQNMKDEDLNKLREMSHHPKVAAIGEIGLDYYYDFSPRDIQKKRFCDQIELAHELKLPIILHDRDAHGDMLDILKQYRNKIHGAVLHCFSGSWEMAKVCLDMGFYIALGGVVTFKNARKTVEVAQKIKMEHLLIETDCPYLAPVPHRGKRNNPCYVREVAERIARIRGIDPEEVAEVTAKNAAALFKIPLG